MALLEMSGLDAGYDDLQVLADVDVEVNDGEYVTIVGPNGAGKSTVMKAIVGLADVFSGSVVWRDSDITNVESNELIELGIGYVPQRNNVFPSLTTCENLHIGAYIYDEFPRYRLEEVYDYFPILEEFRDRKAGLLSGGQQQMLAMGKVLMTSPDILLLDEPSAGLAPNFVDQMFEKVDELHQSGVAILMVEQNAREALKRCDRGYVLAGGENRFQADGRALLADEEIRREFLGGTA